MANYTFQPFSRVRVELFSQPRSLGEFAVNARGVIESAVALPTNIDEGIHTVHVIGVSDSGEAIDLYDVFTVRDAEEHGVQAVMTNNLSGIDEVSSANALAPHSEPLIGANNTTGSILGDTSRSAALLSDATDLATRGTESVKHVLLGIFAGLVVIAALFMTVYRWRGRRRI